MFWSIAAPIIGSLVSGILNRKNNRNLGNLPQSAEYRWQQQYGPEMMTQLRGEANRLITNPYGLGDVKNRLMTTARDTATASYASQQNEIARQAKLAGLSPAGGQATRQQYYAGEQQAQGLNQAYSGIELQDFLAREEQKNRGLNLMLSLSKSNPALSQLASYDYWRQVQGQERDEDQINQLIGGISGEVSRWDWERYYGGQGQRGPGGQIWNRPVTGGPGNSMPAEEVPYSGNYQYQNPYAQGGDSGWWGMGSYYGQKR